MDTNQIDNLNFDNIDRTCQEDITSKLEREEMLTNQIERLVILQWERDMGSHCEALRRMFTEALVTIARMVRNGGLFR